MGKPRERHTLTNRQKIAEALLEERLGLQGEWQDLESIAPLPKTLTDRGAKLAPSVLQEIGNLVTQLADLGCRREVLYWCLMQMDRDAEMVKTAGPWITTFRDGENEGTPRRRVTPLPTQVEMDALISKLDAASKIIYLYQHELLICAELICAEHEWPSEAFSRETHDATTSMQIAKSAVGWLKELARYWETPSLGSLMKSTGVLYLLIYVWICISRSSARSLRRTANEGKRKNRNRLPSKFADILAQLADSYCGIGLHPDVLNDKLQDFQDKHPALFARMVDLLKTLHSKALSASTS
jgi:hypothetical protein